jgi:hypothetical protein
VEHRGALLGPEKSGPADKTLVLGVGSGVSGSRIDWECSWLVWWLGPALIKPLVWVFRTGWVVSPVRVPGPVGGGLGLVFLPVF